MNEFSKFAKTRIADRQIDTLIGISKGLIADGYINFAEAEFLQTWLIQNVHEQNNPIIRTLLDRITEMLADGMLDEEEQAELYTTLRTFNGPDAEIGEVGKSSNLPLCDPAPDVIFQSRVFCFTGTFEYGKRMKCHNAVSELGGKHTPRITLKLNYLVLGTYVTNSWMHETFGRKIEKAMEYRDNPEDAVPLSIISERHFVKALSSHSGKR